MLRTSKFTLRDFAPKTNPLSQVDEMLRFTQRATVNIQIIQIILLTFERKAFTGIDRQRIPDSPALRSQEKAPISEKNEKIRGLSITGYKTADLTTMRLWSAAPCDSFITQKILMQSYGNVSMGFVEYNAHRGPGFG